MILGTWDRTGYPAFSADTGGHRKGTDLHINNKGTDLHINMEGDELVSNGGSPLFAEGDRHPSVQKIIAEYDPDGTKNDALVEVSAQRRSHTYLISTWGD